MIAFIFAQSALCACIALALMLRDVGREIASHEAAQKDAQRKEADRRNKQALREIFYGERRTPPMRSGTLKRTVRCFGVDVQRCPTDLADGGSPLLSVPLEFKEACERHSPPLSSTSSPVAVVGLAMVAAWLLGMFFGLSEVVAAVLLLACWGVSTSLIRCAVGPSDAS